MRSLAPLAQLATRSVRSSASLLATAPREYSCSCRSSKIESAYSQMGKTKHTLCAGLPRTYSTTPSMLSTSPFRLKSTPQQPTEYGAELGGEEQQQEEEGYYSPYKPKRQWPPDMSKLSPKHQFRLERKYRRRAALKYARPRWVKATKLVQWGVIIFVVIYSVLFMEWSKEGEEHPYEEFRQQFFTSFNSLFSTPQPPTRKKE